MMRKRQILELPVFPCSLVDNWGHPDIFSGLIYDKAGCGFVFQPFKENCGAKSDSFKCIPEFIWLVNTELNLFTGAMADFFSDLHNSINPDSDGAFSLQAMAWNKSASCGASWKILYNGVQCGELLIYSEVSGIPTSITFPLIRINLEMLQKSILKDFKAEISWQNGRPAGSFLSLKSWLEQPSGSNDAAGYFQQIVNEKRNPEHLLGNLLAFYSSYFECLAEDEALNSSFFSVLSDCTFKLFPELKNRNEGQNS